jgi:8-oxo-dGTP diphosphatase
MNLQVGVKVFLKNGEGKYLLLRKSPEKYPEVGAKWDIVGGRIVPGTPLIENLKREVYEETKLDLTETPTLVAAQDILRVHGRHVVRLTYAGTIDGEPQLDEEHLEHRWFTREELKNLAEDELDMYFKELLDAGAV